MNISLEPLRVLLHPVALLAFAAAGQAWLDGAAVRGVVAAVLGVLIAGATEAARSRVVPEVKVDPSVRAAKSRRSSWGRADGYGLVELLVALILLILLIWLVVALVPDADAAVAALRSSWG